MENGDETFASPTAAAAEFDQTLTNGGVADEGLTAAHPAKPYDTAEIDALREAKRDLEEKLATVTHENHFLTNEARRLEGLLSQAQDEITTAEQAASTSEGKILSLSAEVKRLKNILDSEMSGHDVEMRKVAGIAAELQTACREKVVLDEAVNGLKASAAAAAIAGKEETAASSTVVPKEAGVASHGLVAAAAAGAAATAAIAVVFLHLKR